MAAANQMASFLATMKWEGGDKLSLDRRDCGNWTGGKIGLGELKGTKWGVAAAAHPNLDIAHLTAEQALAIFLAGYWRPIDGDDLPSGLDHSASDDAYNCGPIAAKRRLAKLKAQAKNLSVIEQIHFYSQLRLSFLESLKTWRIFRRGWARRVAGVEAESLEMALNARAATNDPSTRFIDASCANLPTPAAHHSAASPEIARACSAAARARRDSVRRLALIGVAATVATPFRDLFVAPLFITLGVGLTVLSLVEFWRCHAHAARRDALRRLAGELGVD